MTCAVKTSSGEPDTLPPIGSPDAPFARWATPTLSAYAWSCQRHKLEEHPTASRSTFVFLLVSGLLLLGIGGAILLVPHLFHASNGIVLGDDPNELSEVRAPGGLLTASSIFILLGAARRSLRATALALTVLVYGSFGLARLLALALDGIPSAGLVGSTVIELVVATIGLYILSRSAAVSSTTRASAPATS